MPKRRESWLNAFLLAAGANQVAEDCLHDDAISLPRVARHVERVVPGIVGSGSAAAIRGVDAVRWRAREMALGERRLARWQLQMARMVTTLAGFTIRPPEAIERRALLEEARRLSSGRSSLPRHARRSVMRLPSCFRNFDQHPADLEVLTEEFARRRPDRSSPLAVVGVRTSGSYTAPLHAAFLKALGYEDVSVVTYRPDRRWRHHEIGRLRRVCRAGGLALVTDDPPKSGGSLIKTARALEALGFGAPSIVPLIQTLEGTVLPERLRTYPSLVLKWPDWSVHARLEAGALRAALAAMLPAVEIDSVERLVQPPRPPRSHIRALFKVRLRDRSTGRSMERDVYVKGVGLGYFGDHSLAVADAVREFVPETIGLRDGLLYRAWLPEHERIAVVTPDRYEAVASAIVDYATARAAGLGVDEDLSLRMVDRGPVWQRAGDLVGKAYGRWEQFVRPLSHPLAKRLLQVANPSVIDGSMELSKWFDAGERGSIRKVDVDERSFSSLDIHCYDHLFDLAGCVDGGADADLASAVRATYHTRTGKHIDAERWLLYRLVHIAELQRDSVREGVDVERAFAREMQRYYAETVFRDLDPGGDGPLCAIDLDWTLEARTLGFPSLTPAGAFALHALARHGYRIVIATGRSLGEVQERCQAYRLAGGVAEYGAAVYDHRTGRARCLLSTGDCEALDRLRVVLGAMPGVELDPAYRHAVRAYTFSATGRRQSLMPALAGEALSRAGLEGTVRAIRGSLQTDFMVSAIDKGVGLRELVAELGDPVVALAVGDSTEDVPFTALARLAMTPAKTQLAASPADVRVLRESGPRSIDEAAGVVLGHRPGHCSRCSVDRMPARSELLLTILAAQDAHHFGKVVHAIRSAVALMRTTA